MKILFLILLTACAHVSDGGYRKKYHLEDVKASGHYTDVFISLTEKMQKCYPQSDYPVYEKIVPKLQSDKNMASIFYEIDNQSMGPQNLFIVDVVQETEKSSIVKIYSRGDIFRAPGVFKHQIQKWLDGQKVDCNSHGNI